MSYDPNQPQWGTPPPPNAGYQPPEGTYPGNVPPPPAWAPNPDPSYAAQGYAAQTPYYQPYAGPMAASTSGWAIASLILSIASYLGLAVVGGILGAIFGHIALNEINKSGGRIQGRGMAMAGLILGYINIGLSICAIVGFFVFVYGALNAAQ